MESTQRATPLHRLWQASPPLTAVGLLMLVVAVASLIAMLVDQRVITGAPAWLKPFKFAISTAIYSLTLAWIFGFLSGWPRVRRVVGWTTAIVFVLEVALIDAQAWRGTTSHFNVSTTLDMVLFVVMGAAILLQTLVSVAVAVALWRAAVRRPSTRMGPPSWRDVDHHRCVDRPAHDAAQRRRSSRTCAPVDA